jgi:hypothetical protein
MSNVTSATASVILAHRSSTSAGKGEKYMLDVTNAHKKILVELNRGIEVAMISDPDLTPLDSMLWGFVKDKLYFLPLPADVDDVWARIRGAVAVVMPDMLCCTKEEMHYRRDICHATSRCHIKL